MLFTRDSRAVLVSRSMERFLDASRDQLLGAEVHDVVESNSLLGRARCGRPWMPGMWKISRKRLRRRQGADWNCHWTLFVTISDEEVSAGELLGALLTLHELESVSEIESDWSFRGAWRRLGG